MNNEFGFMDTLKYKAFRSPIGKYIFKYTMSGDSDLDEIHFKTEDEMLKITGLPFGDNNYTYIIEHEQTTIIIDPGRAIKRDNSFVLLTHCHWDHCSGLDDMKVLDSYSFGDIGTKIKDGQILTFGKLDFKVHCVNTHSICSVVYELAYDDELHIFTGDSLFNCGTGKFFEGKVDSLYSYINLLKTYNSKKSWLWPGHDYLQTNRDWCKELDKEVPRMTIPFTIESQILYSPFFDVAKVKAKLVEKYGDFVDEQDGVVLLRKWKDEFDPSL